MKPSTLNNVCLAFYVASAIPAAAGFYHLWVYSNDVVYGQLNAYVGGDAYNYIINASQAVAYFVVALCFVVIATGCLVAQAVLRANPETEN